MNRYSIHFLGGSPGSRIDIEADYWEISVEDYIVFYRDVPGDVRLLVLGVPAALNPIVLWMGKVEDE